jgi:hypothetical protein
MKLSLALTTLPLFVFTKLAMSSTVSFDTIYDKRGESLDQVACSDGPNGLITKGFTTFGSLPSFPFIGGASVIAGWNSAQCGTCWNLTYASGGKESVTVSVLAIDTSSKFTFNVAQEALDKLTGQNAVHDGVVEVESKKVEPSFCGL